MFPRLCRRASDAKSGPLAGIRILDLTSVVLGPLATRYSATRRREWMNSGRRPDALCRAGPAPRDGAHLPQPQPQQALARGRSQTGDGRRYCWLWCDERRLVHNMRPQAIERLGFAWERLPQVKPRLVYCAAMVRPERPDCESPPLTTSSRAPAGSSLERREREKSRILPTLIGDKTTGLAMVYAVLAALFRASGPAGASRSKCRCSKRWPRSSWPSTGRAHLRSPARAARLFADAGAGPPSHRTADGHICILPYSDRHWRDFFRRHRRSSRTSSRIRAWPISRTRPPPRRRASTR